MGPGWGPRTSFFRPQAAAALKRHTWPGNVRELANVIEHALILCDQGTDPANIAGQRFYGGPACRRPDRFLKPPAACSLRELEMQAIQDALDRNGGNKSKAAEELGVSLKTLYNKLNQVGTLEKTA